MNFIFYIFAQKYKHIYLFHNYIKIDFNLINN